VDAWINVFLILPIVGGEWSASRLGRVNPGEISSGALWIGGWVGPRTGTDDVEKRKISPLSELELRPSAVRPLASRYTECSIPAHDMSSYLNLNARRLSDNSSSRFIAPIELPAQYGVGPHKLGPWVRIPFGM
jgi:hypothetical protein